MNNFKKSVMVAALMAASTGAMAADASGTFQWQGTVPGANEENGVCILNINGDASLTLADATGALTFENNITTGDYNIIASDVLSYKVKSKGSDGICGNGGDNDDQNIPFKSTLSNKSVTINGALSEKLTEYNIEFSDGSNTNENWSVSNEIASSSGAQVNLNVTGTNLTGLSGGEVVAVTAFVLVTDTTN